MSTPSSTDTPFPGPFTAIAMTAVAWGTFHYWSQITQGRLGVLASLAFSALVAYGLVGALALPQVPRPWAKRLGMAPLAPRHVAHVVLLLAAFAVGLELQAAVRFAAGRPGGVGLYTLSRGLITTESTWGIVVVFVILIPVVTEWFFRGVVQQGLVARLGPTRGLLMTAALTASLHAGPREDPAVWIAVVLSAGWWALVAGALRLTTGSLLAPILVHAGWNAMWVVAVLTADSAPIPALTAQGASLPIFILVPAVVAVAAGAVLLWRDWRSLD